MTDKMTSVRKEDTEELAIGCKVCYDLLDSEQKESFMNAFNIAKGLINRYAQEAVAAKVEAELLKGKLVQVKLATSDIVRAIKKFKDV